jgi:hypothetical protein
VTDPGESYLPWDRWPLLKMTLRDGADGQGLNRPPTAYETVVCAGAEAGPNAISFAAKQAIRSLLASDRHAKVRLVCRLAQLQPA